MPSHSRAAWRKANLREGYTTSACATAAACAATHTLVTGQRAETITIDLPVRSAVTFPIETCLQQDHSVTCGVIKDAGDDPDVTHGLEIRAEVAWRNEPGIVLEGGVGVGHVTKPGLPVPVGEPAINPVPRRMIIRGVANELSNLGAERSVQVTISVPGGEAAAQQTMNPKLGIIGGISILGTSGIVKPFSVSAYRASIYIELKMAAYNNVNHVVLTTGARSETYAEGQYPHLPEYAFVQVGDHLDYGLKQTRRLQFQQVTLSGMVGKLSKVAAGQMQTHISQGGVDLGFLADVAARIGADAELQEAIRNANTAHHVQVLLRQAGIDGLETYLAQQAAEKAAVFINHAVPINVLLWDIRGKLLAEGTV